MPGAEKYIIDSLAWLGISPDDGVNADGTAKYRQSERAYKSFVDTLLTSSHVYYAFDTKEDLVAMKGGDVNIGYTSKNRMTMKNSHTLSADEVKSRLDSGASYVIRFNTPANKEIRFTDIVKGDVVFNSNDMDDKVLFKSDGLPTYHLANVVDDHLMEITHVIRGDEWLSSAPLHIMLYDAFGWDTPSFCHLPLILGPDKKKLSKRHGDKYGFPVFPMTWDYVNENKENVHVTGFKDEDYEPDALINFLVLLGWNPGNTEEIMSMDRMIELFDLGKINKAGAMFDIAKLKNFNAHYLRNRSVDVLFATILSSYKGTGGSINASFLLIDNMNTIVSAAKDRSTFGKELYSKVSYFFEPVVLKEDAKLKNDVEFREVMSAFFLTLASADKWKAEFIKNRLESLCKEKGFEMGKILPDLRMALSGNIPGPHLPETMELLGKEESMNRIGNLMKKTEKAAG